MTATEYDTRCNGLVKLGKLFGLFFDVFGADPARVYLCWHRLIVDPHSVRGEQY